jgi:hypothetical protein
MGVDDGDSDKFKIGTTAIGTSTALTIDGSQNIGIGTAAPGSKLDISVPAGAAQLTIQAGTSDSVTGEASIKLISRNSGSGSSPPAEIRNIWGGSNDSDLAFYTTTDGSTMVEQMRINDVGLVGIGTTAPGSYAGVQTNLEVKTASHGGIALNVGADSFGGLFFIANDVSKWNLAMENAASPDLTFYEGSTIRMTLNDGGIVNVAGTFTAGTKTFQIPHPLPEKSENYLVHACLEGPRLDLIYRSTVTLVAGSATVDLDDAAGMTAGTWALLCRDAQVFTTNETGWFHVRGTVSGSTLTIECEEGTCTDTVSWMVVAERQDDAIKAQSSTDEDGHLILEPLKSPPDTV